MHSLNTFNNIVLYNQITDGIDLIGDMTQRFPYKYQGIDKNGNRCKGGVLIPGLQAYECADGWVQMLELDMVEPLDKIASALDKPNASSVKRTAISSAIFCMSPVMIRVLLFLASYRDAFAKVMKDKP